MKIGLIVLILVILVTSCSGTPKLTEVDIQSTISAGIEMTQKANPTSTDTQIPTSTLTETPTQTPTNTNTPTATNTATVTNTPTITETPTVTNTLTPTLTPVPLSAYTTEFQTIESYLEEPDKSKGKTFKALLENVGSIYIENKEATAFVVTFPEQKMIITVFAIPDKKADETVDLDKNKFSWAYATIIGNTSYAYFQDNKYSTATKYEMPVISIVHQDLIDELKWPKWDGLYYVNTEIAAGSWISSEQMTTDGCYWARINSKGDIIDNHYGVAGITVYVSPSDAVIEFDGCGKMYFGDY